MRMTLVSFMLALSGCAIQSHAGLAFSSDFAGQPNWNWTAAVGNVGGTDAMTVSFGNPVAAAYLRKTVTDPAMDSPDGTGHMRVSFDVDMGNLAFTEWYNGPTLFEIDTPGNKGARAGGFLAAIGTGNWKASAGVKGEFRFSVSISQIYANGSSAAMSAFTPTGPTPWTYHIVMDLLIGKSEAGWPVTATLAVTGPSSGTTVTKSVSTSMTMTYATYMGFRSVDYGYFFGGLNSSAVYPGSSLALDNLLVEWITPPPSATILLLR